MMQKKRAAIIQMALLFVIQWLSISSIVLNALALSTARHLDQGLIVASEYGPQEYTLLIMGAISLFASSILLITYVHIFLRLLGDRPLKLSKRILAFEIGLTLIVIALWSTASGIILTRYNASSFCKNSNTSGQSLKDILMKYSSSELSYKACSLADAMFVVGFIAIAVWLATLIVSIYSLSQLNNFSAGGLFTLQAPVHPYEDVKVKSDSDDYKQNPVTDDKFTKIEAIVVTTAAPEGGATRGIQQQQQKKQGEKESRKIATADDLQHNQPQEMKPAKTVKSWNFDFSFEPIHLDLMLPSTSELIGSRKKKISNIVNTYPSYP
ncbi:hypothetical protein BD408DRAFT_441424 [Parasitella parasitica]|nr:hypothetical protein BD408DRAFT_441424 [Parasitella parasitica]